VTEQSVSGSHRAVTSIKTSCKAAHGGLDLQQWIANKNSDYARLEELGPMLDAQKREAAALMAMLHG
jgi:hypothetical protein